MLLKFVYQCVKNHGFIKIICPCFLSPKDCIKLFFHELIIRYEGHAPLRLAIFRPNPTIEQSKYTFNKRVLKILVNIILINLYICIVIAQFLLMIFGF